MCVCVHVEYVHFLSFYIDPSIRFRMKYGCLEGKEHTFIFHQIFRHAKRLLQKITVFCPRVYDGCCTYIYIYIYIYIYTVRGEGT